MNTTSALVNLQVERLYQSRFLATLRSNNFLSISFQWKLLLHCSQVSYIDMYTGITCININIVCIIRYRHIPTFFKFLQEIPSRFSFVIMCWFLSPFTHFDLHGLVKMVYEVWKCLLDDLIFAFLNCFLIKYKTVLGGKDIRIIR